MTKPLHESVRTLAEATQSETSGLLEVEFITPGWGSSGYYSRQVLEAAVPLFAAGTQMYFDHASASERSDRPERSVRDIAAVIEESGFMDPATGGIRGKVRPLKAYTDLLTDETFAKNVGLSISGSATDITVGEAEGRTGPIIEGLAALDSVDFVTRAGRGGRVMAVLESAGVVSEATSHDRLDQVRDAIRSKYRTPGFWAYTHDIDADNRVCWFTIEPESGPSVTYQQEFTVDANDVDVTLVGDPTEVKRLVTYVPVNPAGRNPTQESKEDTMPQIEESRLAALEEASGRVPALEERATTAEAQRDAAIRERDAERAVNRARTLISTNESRRTAGVEFTSLEERGLLAGLALTDEGVLDEAGFTTAVDAAVAEASAARGAGSVTGFGRTTPVETGAVTESDLDNAVGSAFGRKTLEG